jgi:hypothetical protein
MPLGPKKTKNKVLTSGRQGIAISQERWNKFFDMLSQTANVTKSAEYAGISRTVIYDRKRDDAEFAKKVDEAYQRGYEVLEEECQRRAFAGYDKPVFQGGRQVGVVREYSDTLAMFLMKGNKPGKYRDRIEATNTNLNLDANKDDQIRERLRAKLLG